MNEVPKKEKKTSARNIVKVNMRETQLRRGQTADQSFLTGYQSRVQD
jgi:hypothetical protein